MLSNNCCSVPPSFFPLSGVSCGDGEDGGDVGRKLGRHLNEALGWQTNQPRQPYQPRQHFCSPPLRGVRRHRAHEVRQLRAGGSYPRHIGTICPGSIEQGAELEWSDKHEWF